MNTQVIDLTSEESSSTQQGDPRVAPPAPSIDLTEDVRSIRCVATGRLFATMAEAQQYAAETGLTSFEEATEEADAASLEDLGLNAAAIRALTDAGYDDVAKVRKAHADGVISEVKGIGPKAQSQIAEALDA